MRKPSTFLTSFSTENQTTRKPGNNYKKRIITNVNCQTSHTKTTNFFPNNVLPNIQTRNCHPSSRNIDLKLRAA